MFVRDDCDERPIREERRVSGLSPAELLGSTRELAVQPNVASVSLKTFEGRMTASAMAAEGW